MWYRESGFLKISSDRSIYKPEVKNVKKMHTHTNQIIYFHVYVKALCSAKNYLKPSKYFFSNLRDQNTSNVRPIKSNFVFDLYKTVFDTYSLNICYSDK